MPTLEKVSAFITRGTGNAQELLVFQHPSTGIQIPAGTVEDGEEIETALWREVREETGLVDLRIRPKLGEQTVLLPPGQRGVLRSLAVRDAPNGSSAEIGLSLRRGLFVYETVRQNDWSQVRYEEFDAAGGVWRVVKSAVGWVPSDALTERVVRHFFHLRCEVPTPERWRCWGEVHCEFELYWTPLVGYPGLAFEQSEWLTQFRDLISVRAGA